MVFGKGSKERMVYFDARTKIHLQNYLAQRTDSNNALFVSLKAPYERLQIGGVESRLRELGKRLSLPRVHPHKFRRTLATMAIDKGMPVEQLQRLLGHQRIDTTLQYAMVKQSNVKIAHRKYIGYERDIMLVTLDSITTKITKGTTPTSVGCTFENSGVNFIKSESLGNSRNIDRSKFAFISEQTHEKLKRSQIEKNDILFSMAGMFLGKTGIVTDDLVPANTNQAVAIIRIDTEKANHEYVYYYLNQRSVVQAVNASSAQSAQPNINLKQIGQIEIDLPERKLQDKIVSILSAIDFKIEKNNQINENLAA